VDETIHHHLEGAGNAAAGTAGICNVVLEDSILTVLHGKVIEDRRLVTSDNSAELDRIAVHEAGHAVAVVYLLQHCKYLCHASIEPRSFQAREGGEQSISYSAGRIGHSEFYRTDYSSSVLKKKHHGKYAIMCFAGRVAELVLYNEPELYNQTVNHDTCATDMSHAQASLEEEALSRYDGYKPCPAIIARNVEANMKTAFKKTLVFIKKHKEDVIKVANYLRNNTRVYGAAIYMMLRVNSPVLRFVNECFQYTTTDEKDDDDEKLQCTPTADTRSSANEQLENDGDDTEEAPIILDVPTVAELEELSPGINLQRTIKFPKPVTLTNLGIRI
jgi:hypothetical protein